MFMSRTSEPSILHSQMTDARIPIAQAGTCPTATTEGGSCIPGKSTGLSDVLRGDPERVADHRCGTVVPPAGARRVADKGFVAGKAIIGPQTRGYHVDRTYATLCIDGSIACARKIVRADHGEGQNASPAGSHPNGGVGQVIVSQSEVALQ